MDLYVNVTDGDIELPNQNKLGTKIVGVGESFYGSPYYDAYVRFGILGKLRAEYSLHRLWVTTDDFQDDPDAAIAATSVPYRFKTDSVSSPTTSASSYLKAKAYMHFAANATPNDSVFVTYMFYMNKDVATLATHTASRVEKLGANWTYPTWAPLPSDFWSLSPKAQRDALLTTTSD